MKTKSDSTWKAIASAMDRAIHEGKLELVTIPMPRDMSSKSLPKFMRAFEQQMTRAVLMAKVEHRLKYLIDPVETIKVWVRNVYERLIMVDSLDKPSADEFHFSGIKEGETLSLVMEISSKYDNSYDKIEPWLHAVNFRLAKVEFIKTDARGRAKDPITLSWSYPDDPGYVFNVFVSETTKPITTNAQHYMLEGPSTTHRVENDLIDAIQASFMRISEGQEKTSFIVELRQLEGCRGHHYQYNDVVKAVAQSAAQAVRVHAEVLLGMSIKRGEESKAVMDQQLKTRADDFRDSLMHMLIHGLVNYFGYGVGIEGETEDKAYLKMEFAHHKGVGAFNTLNVVAVHATLVHPSMITKNTPVSISHKENTPDHLFFNPSMMLVRYQKFSKVAAELPA